MRPIVLFVGRVVRAGIVAATAGAVLGFAAVGRVLNAASETRTDTWPDPALVRGDPR